MKEQERKIISILLNEMAFEGAHKHFDEPFPEIPQAILTEIEEIEIPRKYDGMTESNKYVNLNFGLDVTDCERCYKYLRTIRNNIIHANKAYRLDTPERLGDLLNCAERFIASVYESDSSFAHRAREIKATMKIESF